MGLSMLIGLVAAFFVYSDAQKRGNSFFASLLWAVGSAAIPIVIVPLYLLLGRKANNLPGRRDSDPDIIDIEATVVEDTVPCPMCAKKVGEDFLVCPYCGHTLRPICKSCGQEVSRECKTCPNCQAQIDPK